MKISEITLEKVKEYLRVTENDDDNLITAIMQSSKDFILSYTGLSDDKINAKPKFVIAFLCLCSDMYDNRQMMVSNDKLNPTVSTILGMDAVNYL